jgi:integrase
MFLKEMDLGSVSQEDFEKLSGEWLTIHRKTLKPRTTNRRMTSLRAFAKWAGWGVLLDDYSAPNPGPSVPHPLPEGIAGVRRMIRAAATDQQRALVVLCGMLGLRVAEALSIKGSDFDVETQTANVVGKGDKTRIIPVSIEAMEYLLMPVAKALFADDTVLLFDDRTARRTITRLGIKAGLMRRVASHDLRATFATEAYHRTKDIRMVQILLGHTSSHTTETYVAVTMDQMRAGVNSL